MLFTEAGKRAKRNRDATRRQKALANLLFVIRSFAGLLLAFNLFIFSIMIILSPRKSFEPSQYQLSFALYISILAIVTVILERKTKQIINRERRASGETFEVDPSPLYIVSLALSCFAFLAIGLLFLDVGLCITILALASWALLLFFSLYP